MQVWFGILTLLQMLIFLKQSKTELHAGFVPPGTLFSTYSWSKSSLTCLHELAWPSLVQRRTYFIVDYLHSILHKMNSFSFHEYFIFNSAPTRSHHLTIRPVHSSINAYRYSFFVNSVFLWNRTPFDILSTTCKYLFRCKLRSYLW